MQHKKKIEQALHWILLCVGFVIFGMLIHRVGWAQLIQLFKTANKEYWFFGIGIYGFSMLFRALKWQILLSVVQPVPMRKFLPIYFFNAVMGNITPFKSGEAIGPLLFKRYLGVEIGQGFSVILIDRIMELIWMLLSLGLGFSYLATHVSMAPFISKTILWAGGLMLLIIVFLILILVMERGGFGVLSFLIQYIKHARLQHFLLRMRDELTHFYEFRKGKALLSKMLILNLFTGLAFLSQFLAAWLIVISLLPVDFMASLTAQAIAIPVSIISFIPAGLGIAAVGYQYIMSQFGYAYDPIVGASLLSKVLFLSLIFICGWISSFKLRRMERCSHE